MSERGQSVNMPVWAIVVITAVLVASVTSLIAVVTLGGDDGASEPETAIATSSSVNQPSSTTSISMDETTSTSTAITPTSLDPTQQLEVLTSALGDNASFSIANGDCPPTAAIVTNEQLRLFEWREVSWLEISLDLFNNSDTPVLSVESDDYAPNSGHESFLVTFNGPAIGGPIYGGILGQYECRWSLIDVLIDGSISKVVIGLDYSPDSGLSGYRTAGGSVRPDIFLSYDPHNVAYFAN